MTVLRVGIIGCGEVAQVSHIPNFNSLSTKYRITYLCDISKQCLQHCAQMVRGGDGRAPSTTTDPEELCASPEVDVVLICSADEYHVAHGLLGLKHNKNCLIEKPLALCFRDLDQLIEAEKLSKGRVFVGTMRRFAPAFLEAVKEVGSMDKIMYARVRSIIGPNSNFINQSCTYPIGAPSDISAADQEDRKKRHDDIVQCALEKEFGVAVTEQSIRQLKILGRYSIITGPCLGYCIEAHTLANLPFAQSEYARPICDERNHRYASTCTRRFPRISGYLQRSATI